MRLNKLRTITNDSLDALPGIVKKLTKKKIFSELSPLDVEYARNLAICNWENNEDATSLMLFHEQVEKSTKALLAQQRGGNRCLEMHPTIQAEVADIRTKISEVAKQLQEIRTGALRIHLALDICQQLRFHIRRIVS